MVKTLTHSHKASPMICWMLLRGWDLLKSCRYSWPCLSCSLAQSFPDIWIVVHLYLVVYLCIWAPKWPDISHLWGRHPSLTNQDSLTLAQGELVQDVVDWLHLPRPNVVQPGNFDVKIERRKEDCEKSSTEGPQPLCAAVCHAGPLSGPSPGAHPQHHHHHHHHLDNHHHQHDYRTITVARSSSLVFTPAIISFRSSIL